MTTHVAATVPSRRLISHKTLVRIQAGSGLAFATFLMLHLANLVAALFGPAAFDGFMRLTRYYYQWPLVEILCVVSAALIHIAAGIARILGRRRDAHPETKPNRRVRLHRYAGYVMMLAFVGHVTATRLPGLLGESVDSTFINFSLTYAGAFFFPYYILFAISGVYHLSHGTLAALRIVGVRLPKGITSPRSRPFWAWAAAGAAVAFIGVLALGGVLYEADQSRAAEWMAYFEKYLPAGWAPW